MTRRGRILRDTTAGPGLLVVDGTQFPFTLEGAWRSSTPPAPGMVVDVDVAEGAVASVAAVPENQLAREQAEIALAAAKERSAVLAGAMVARFGAPTLAATGALVTGWLVLSAGSVDAFVGRMTFTFWDVLGVVNADGIEAMMQRLAGRSGGAGIYGFVAALAMASPFAPAVWKDRRAHLLGLLPLLLMLFVAWQVFNVGFSGGEREAVRGAGAQGAEDLGRAMAGMIDEAMREARAELRKAISIGPGTYVSGAASLYLAALGVRRFLAASRGA